MIAKFQIILEGATPLKIQCVDKFPDEKLDIEKHVYLNRGYKQDDNSFKHDELNNLIIFENVKNLKFSKYKHYCLKSAYERYIQGRESY